MRWLLVLLVAMSLGFGRPAAAQAPATDEKPTEKPDWAALLGFDRPAAQARYDNESTPEGWVWARIRQDKVADLNLRCDAGGKTHLDSHDDAGWDDACRKIPAGFVADVLTVPRWRDRIGRHGFRLLGARIDGDVDLANADIRPDLLIDASRIEGTLNLTGAHLAGVLSLRGTQVHGDFAGDRMRADSGLFLGDRATITGNVILRSAKVGVQVAMDGATVEGTVDADSLSLEGSLFLRNGAMVKGNVKLPGAKVGADVDMTDASFVGGINADGLSVGGNLYLRCHATFKGGVSLVSAKVVADVDMGGYPIKQKMCLPRPNVRTDADLISPSFAGTVNADGLSVGGNLLLRGGATFKESMILFGAKVGGQVSMRDSTFERNFVAEAITVGASILVDDARFDEKLDLSFAHIGGGLNLTGAVASSIDLTDAAIASDLTLGNSESHLQWRCPGSPAADAGGNTAPSGTGWPLGDQGWRSASCGKDDVPAMILRNARIGALQDSAGAWPPALDLEGFKYDRLGGIGGFEEADMRRRSPAQWQDWLDRDATFSTQPYTQLAGVLLAAGHRDTAEAIQYFGRERERREALARGDLRGGAWLTFLWAVAGYGIGTYTFRVLYWVVGLTVLGTLVLLTAPKARRHGLLWCFGASLQRLLPVVEFNKRFKDFFDNPPPSNDEEVSNLNGVQAAFFSILALAGWVLGFVLLAAMTNLTPKG